MLLNAQHTKANFTKNPKCESCRNGSLAFLSFLNRRQTTSARNSEKSNINIMVTYTKVLQAQDRRCLHARAQGTSQIARP